MILRHVTLKKYLPKIVEINSLYAEAHRVRKISADGGYNAFEVNPISNVLVRIFPLIKSNPFNTYVEGDQFELLFDGDRMLADGLVLEDLGQSKIQLQYLVHIAKITTEEYESIGQFRFIAGEVSLNYLTQESRDNLNNYINTLS